VQREEKVVVMRVLLSLSLTHTHTHTLSLSLSLSLTHTHTHTGDWIPGKDDGFREDPGAEEGGQTPQQQGLIS